MPRREARRLVIDASVVLAAGTRACRDFLQAVLAGGYHVVLTAEIDEEWKNPPPRLAYPRYPVVATTWRRTMVARKQIDRMTIPAKVELRRKIEHITPDLKARGAMLEDFHLIEAALETDKTIASRDEEVRKLFRGTTLVMGELREIVWANPDHPREDCLTWLATGAEPEKHRLLGFQAPDIAP